MTGLGQLFEGRLAPKLGVAVLIVLAAYPFVAGEFQLFLLTRVLVLCLAVLGLDIAWGYGGVLNLGHAVFFGLGAYTFGVVARDLSVGHELAVVVAMLVPAAFALVVGYPVLSSKLEEAYFGIVMLAVAALAPLSINSSGVLGGSDGFGGIPDLTVFGLEFEGVGLYYLVLLVATLGLVGAYLLLEQSPFGLRLRAIRINEGRTRVLGYNPLHYKVAAFVLSGLVTGLAGALHAALTGFVGPSSIGFFFSLEVIIWLIVGGTGTLFGGYLGVFIIKYTEFTLSGALLEVWQLVLGVIFVLMVLFVPEGLYPWLDALRSSDRVASLRGAVRGGGSE